MGSSFVPDGEYFLKNRISLQSLHLKSNPAGVGQAQIISHLKLTGRRLHVFVAERLRLKIVSYLGLIHTCIMRQV